MATIITIDLYYWTIDYTIMKYFNWYYTLQWLCFKVPQFVLKWVKINWWGLWLVMQIHKDNVDVFLAWVLSRHFRFSLELLVLVCQSMYCKFPVINWALYEIDFSLVIFRVQICDIIFWIQLLTFLESCLHQNFREKAFAFYYNLILNITMHSYEILLIIIIIFFLLRRPHWWF